MRGADLLRRSRLGDPGQRPRRRRNSTRGAVGDLTVSSNIHCVTSAMPRNSANGSGCAEPNDGTRTVGDTLDEQPIR
jgi:hypothetical protein